MEPNLPQPNIEMSPLERLETTTEAMILAQERASQKQIQVMEGLEPVMEALISAYVNGAGDIKSSIASIQDYLSKIEPVAVNDKILPLLKKLDKTFTQKNLFSVPAPTVIQDSKDTVRLLKDLIEAVELKPLEVNLSNDFTAIEKALRRIEKLVNIEIPLDDGRVAVKLSDADLDRLAKTIGNIPWQMNGTASEETLQKVAGLNIPAHDTITAAYTDETDIFTYKLSGRTVATVTITYTDDTKELISSVTKA